MAASLRRVFEAALARVESRVSLQSGIGHGEEGEEGKEFGRHGF